MLEAKVFVSYVVCCRSIEYWRFECGNTCAIIGWCCAYINGKTYNFQPSHILGASRGHLSASAILLFWWAPEFLFTLASGHFRRSRASKVIAVGANRKHVCRPY